VTVSVALIAPTRSIATMDQLDEMFADGLESLELSFGVDDGLKHQSDTSAVVSDEHQFLEEFKARDEEFLSLMRNYEHLPFKSGAEEARTAAIELAGNSKCIRKADVVRLFGHAGGWKIGHLEVAELMRAVGKQTEGDLISVSSCQEFLMSTSIAKNARNDAFQPKLPSKLNSVLIDGFPVKTSVALVNSLCSEHGMIREVKLLDSDMKQTKSKKTTPQKFLVTFEDAHSALRAVQILHGFSSKRIPGPLTCVLCDMNASSVDAISPDDSSSSESMIVGEVDAPVQSGSVSTTDESCSTAVNAV